MNEAIIQLTVRIIFLPTMLKIVDTI